MSDPQVSVVLPTRNRPQMLRQALASALAQKAVDIEVIVVDEASSDETLELLERIDDERLLVLRHESPRGVAGARNAAIERARGAWIAFLDDDDLWAPGKLGTQLSAASAGGASLAYSAMVEIDEAVSMIRLMRPPDPATLARRLLASNVIGSPSGVILRRELLERGGAFDESLSALADWDLWIRASWAGKAAASGEPLAAYRHHRENMMVTQATRVMEEFRLLQAKHLELSEQAGVEFGTAWLARWTASRDLAEGRRLEAARGYLRRAAMERSPRYAARAVGALGGERLQRLGRSAVARLTPRPDWLDLYA